MNSHRKLKKERISKFDDEWWKKFMNTVSDKLVLYNTKMKWGKRTNNSEMLDPIIYLTYHWSERTIETNDAE